MLPSLLTLTAVGLFVAGIRSLISLNRMALPEVPERQDPFFDLIGLLFFTGTRTPEFEKLQRRTIWLFSTAMLLLYLARVAFMQTE